MYLNLCWSSEIDYGTIFVTFWRWTSRGSANRPYSLRIQEVLYQAVQYCRPCESAAKCSRQALRRVHTVYAHIEVELLTFHEEVFLYHYLNPGPSSMGAVLKKEDVQKVVNYGCRYLKKTWTRPELTAHHFLGIISCVKVRSVFKRQKPLSSEKFVIRPPHLCRKNQFLQILQNLSWSALGR